MLPAPRDPNRTGRWRLPLLVTALVALDIIAVWRLTSSSRASTEDVILPMPAQAAAASGDTPPAGALPRGSSSGAVQAESLSAVAAAAAPRGASAAGSTSVGADTTAAGHPVAFRARTLVGDDDEWRERECHVVIADGRISVQADEDQPPLYVVPYGSVLSVSYSHTRHPLWNGPDGPTRIARTGGGLFRMRGARHWVSIRSNKRDSPFVVLRVDNETQTVRAINLLQARTGRTVEVVSERNDE